MWKRIGCEGWRGEPVASIDVFWEKKRWDEGQERCPNKDDHADFFHPSGVPPPVSNWYYKAACENCNRPILLIRNRGYRIESGAGSFAVPGTGYS